MSDVLTVQIWYTWRPTRLASATDHRLRAVLDFQEQDWFASLATAEMQDQFLVSRGELRYLLSRYVNVAPDAWRFGTNAWGRPTITAPRPPSDLDFNTAHAAGCHVWGISPGSAVGVDVERVSDSRVTEKAVETYFTPEENRWLRATPAAQRRLHLVRLWTLKEAYVKALGRGLSTPLDSFSIWLPEDESEPIRMSLTSKATPEQQGVAWRFAQWQLGDYLVAAAAACPEPYRSVEFELRELRPLDSA